MCECNANVCVSALIFVLVSSHFDVLFDIVHWLGARFFYIFLCALPNIHRAMYSVWFWFSIQVDSFQSTPFFRFEIFKVMAKVSAFYFEMKKRNHQCALFVLQIDGIFQKLFIWWNGKKLVKKLLKSDKRVYKCGAKVWLNTLN